MLKVEYYNPSDEKKGCVFRSLSKALNKSYDEVKEDLRDIGNSIGVDDLLDDKVFDTYLLNNGYKEINIYKDTYLLDNKYDDVNLVYSYSDDWYHMICIIDNVIYDKFDLDRLKNLKVIKIYKK